MPYFFVHCQFVIHIDEQWTDAKYYKSTDSHTHTHIHTRWPRKNYPIGIENDKSFRSYNSLLFIDALIHRPIFSLSSLGMGGVGEGIAQWYGAGLWARSSGFESQQMLGNFFLHHSVQTGFGTHTASYPTGTRGSFPGDEAARVWSWPLASVKCRGQEWAEPYRHSANTPSWRGAYLGTGKLTLPYHLGGKDYNVWSANSMFETVWTSVLDISLPYKHL
jgi:hypothetical protein